MGVLPGGVFLAVGVVLLVVLPLDDTLDALPLDELLDEGGVLFGEVPGRPPLELVDLVSSSSSLLISWTELLACPSSHLFTSDANLKLERDSSALISVGERLAIIRVFPSPLKLGCSRYVSLELRKGI